MYRLLLLALPRPLRREFGADMAQMFADWQREIGRRPIAQLGLWFAAIRDVVAEGIRERRGADRRPGLSDEAFGGPAKSAVRTSLRASFADIRHGLRLLRRSPGSSLLALATLALGIGINTAIFSVVDAVLLRSLPYPQPDRLAMVWEKRPSEGAMTNVVSPADYLDWRRLNTSFDHMAALLETSVSMTGAGEPVQVPTALVGGAFFDVLGVRPLFGSTFTEANEAAGQNTVVVLGYGLWQSRFGGDKDLIGKTITLNGRNVWRVAGILPPDFQFIDPSIQLWAPLVLEGGSTAPTRVSHSLDVYARLKPGVTMAQAREAMDRLGRDLEQQHPDENRGHGANVVSMRDIYVRDVQTSLIAIFAAVGLVLLIACVNVANLLLTRAVSRQRELAVRAALGATRGRLITQALAESVSLSLLGGAAGIGVAMLVLRALPVVMPDRLSVVGLDTIHLDLRVLAFACLLSMATGVIFGLLPALTSSRPDLNLTLKDSGRGAISVRRRARIGLVIGEVALASLTLVAAGLVVRSFATILSQPLGFDPHNRLTLAISLTRARYPTPDAARDGLDQIRHACGRSRA